MDHQFDVLSKRLANTVTRREAASIMVRAIFGTLVSATGLNRAWAWSSASGNASGDTSSVCSECGACEEFNVQTGKISDCSNSCLAQTLCKSAEKNSNYKLLLSDLTTSRGYQFKSYQALVTVNGSEKTTVLVANLVGQGSKGQNPPATAGLTYSVTPKGTIQTNSTEFIDGVPQYAYVASGGLIQQILPYQFESASVATDRFEEDFESADLKESGSLCKTTMSWVCGKAVGSTLECLEVAAGACAFLDEVPPLAAACFGAVYIACKKGSSAACNSVATKVCNCLGGGVPCGEGSVCSGACPDGDTCSKGVCTHSCPAGYTPCGDSCLQTGAGDYCCAGSQIPVGDTCCAYVLPGGVGGGWGCAPPTTCCSGGTCCDADFTCCGGTLCCEAGTTCCVGTVSTACCDPGYTCSDGNCNSE